MNIVFFTVLLVLVIYGLVRVTSKKKESSKPSAPAPQKTIIKKEAQPKPREEIAADDTSKEQKDLLWKLYRSYSYGENAKASLLKERKKIEAEALRLGLNEGMQQAKEDGFLAYQLKQTLRNVYRKEGLQAGKEFIVAQRQAQVASRVVSTLHYTLRREECDNKQWQLYLRYVWGSEKTGDGRQIIARLEQEAKEAGCKPQNIELAASDGERAALLSKQLKEVFSTQGEKVAEQWITEQEQALRAEKLTHTSVKRIVNTLKHYQRENIKRQQNTKHRYAKPKQSSSIAAVQLQNGRHPNSLRNLNPARKWRVYIDETGTEFGQQAEQLKSNDYALGKVVAVVVPDYAKLQPLQSFHAVDQQAGEVDKVVESLLREPVGIFGFSVQDNATNTYSWFGHVNTLLRWVLLQLPHDGGPCEVECLIEQREGALPVQPLHDISSMLLGELQAIDAEKYQDTLVTVNFMDKEHAYNGYPDAIAFTWGSSANASRDRLRKSRLLGHCLLRPSDDGLERLYLALTQNRLLLPHEWYRLCSAAAQVPEDSLLPQELRRLGEKAQRDVAVWRDNLDEVKRRLRVKDYQLAEISYALDWLEQFMPQGERLVGLQALTLQTARLAHHNHQGEVQHAQLEDLLQSMEALKDEAPAEVCEALLRCAVSATNGFEFAAYQETLQRWANEPVAVPGLLNHGKLLSTLGQLHAFQGQPQVAIDYFDQALAAFERLSDPAQAQREIQQTNTYRLIALLHVEGTTASQVLTPIVELLGRDTSEQASRSMGCSGQTLRFTHHLWLRTLITFPQHIQAEREAYLSVAGQWQYGEDHPWPLIEAYRGWLFMLEGKAEDASQRFCSGIAYAADETGPTLQWMAEVLRCLAQALGVAAPAPRVAERERLQKLLPAAPHDALARFSTLASPEHGAMVAALRECLPFNFH